MNGLLDSLPPCSLITTDTTLGLSSTLSSEEGDVSPNVASPESAGVIPGLESGVFGMNPVNCRFGTDGTKYATRGLFVNANYANLHLIILQNNSISYLSVDLTPLHFLGNPKWERFLQNLPPYPKVDYLIY